MTADEEPVLANYAGPLREASVAERFYASDNYFKLDQLFAFALQIYHIHAMKPRDMLEIGVGNGFVSTFMRQTGTPVTTADINPRLKPDICAPLAELRSLADGQFDLVVCCEVLEHIALDELDANLTRLRSLGSKLFMTLPTVHTTVGLGGLLRIPGLPLSLLNLNIDLPRKHKIKGTPHLWEVGYTAACSKRAIVAKLRQLYDRVETGRFAMKPNHMYFKCR